MCFNYASTDADIIKLEPLVQEFDPVPGSHEDNEIAQLFKVKFPTASAAALEDYTNIDQTLDIAHDIQAASSSENLISDSEYNDEERQQINLKIKLF